MSDDTSLARIAALLDVALLDSTRGINDDDDSGYQVLTLFSALGDIRPADLTWLHEVAAAYAVDDAPVHLPPIERRRYVATLQEDA